MKKSRMRTAYASLLVALIPACALICSSPSFAKEAASPLLSPATSEDIRFQELSRRLESLKKGLVSKDLRLQKLIRRIELLRQELASKERRVQELARATKGFKQEIASKDRLLKEVRQDVDALKHLLASKDVQLTELGKRVGALNEDIASKDVRFKEVTQGIDAMDQSIASKSLFFSLATGGALLLAAIASLTSLLLHRRARALEGNLARLTDKKELLESPLTEELEKESHMLERITAAFDDLKQSLGKEASGDFIELITAVANRLAFMEVTLYRMDSSVKGHRQLVRSLSQIRSNLLANGFEVVEMLGKPYSEGMRVVAAFVDDESLEKGSQIITGIIKPQINYKGKTIQAAQITVSQNI